MNNDACKICPASYAMSFHKSVKTFRKCLEINGHLLEEIIPKIFENAVLSVFPLLYLPSSFL